MAKFSDLPSVKLHNKVNDLQSYFNSKYDRKNNQIERQYYNYILSKVIGMIAELKYDESNKVIKQLAKLQLQNIAVKVEYAIKINNPKYLDQFATLLNYIEAQKEVKFKGVNNEGKNVTVKKFNGKDSGYSINVESTLSKNHTIYRTNLFDDFVNIFEEICHDTRFEMYDYINNKTV